MLGRWNNRYADFDEMFSTLHGLREYMDRVLAPAGSEPQVAGAAAWSGQWPRANFVDAGTQLVVSAEVPGLTEKDIQLTLNQDVLSIAGERRHDGPEGYAVHRAERPAMQFARSFALPCKIDPERASASVKNGVLTITLEKARDAIPRQITVQTN
jgi:HSP20 family protein